MLCFRQMWLLSELHRVAVIMWLTGWGWVKSNLATVTVQTLVQANLHQPAKDDVNNL